MNRAAASAAATMASRSGAHDKEVLRAMGAVPRDRFVPAELRSMAYEDEPLPLAANGSTISAPHMVAIQLEAARLSEGLHVLEVGSGSGYLLALVSEVMHRTGRVLGLEIDPGLVEGARSTLTELGYADGMEVRCADGWAGAMDRAPFDRILVSCAVPEIAPAWRAQLEASGRIVAPVGDGHRAQLRSVRKDGRVLEAGPACRFVPVRRARDPIYRA